MTPEGKNNELAHAHFSSLCGATNPRRLLYGATQEHGRSGYFGTTKSKITGPSIHEAVGEASRIVFLNPQTALQDVQQEAAYGAVL